MTEIEKIERAKAYMEKLANGIDPISNTMAPEEDIINNVRLSRCFFFVSDVLRQIIENGGIKPVSSKKTSKKLAFWVPLERRNQFEYSEKPIPVSEITRRINALIDTENMKRLTYSGILTWLIKINMIELVLMADGRSVKRPTKIGRESGISVEERTGSSGPYQVVVYNSEAQHFIVDNLDVIVAVGNADVEMQGAPWTKGHDECLADLYKRAVPIDEIAITLKRSTSAVRGRLKKLGFINSQ